MRKCFLDLDDLKLRFEVQPEEFESDENYRLFVNRSQEIVNSTFTRVIIQTMIK